METSFKKSSILFISTYPPKKCGIASFTQDLLNAIKPEISKYMNIEVCALDKSSSFNDYEPPVGMLLNGNDLNSCLLTAAKINKNANIKLVCIEHEFGLYGGELGEYLLGFLSVLEKPFIIRFHTVLPNPSTKMLSVVKSIELLAERIIVMTKNSSRILQSDYQVDNDKIIIIPHGTHDPSTTDINKLKFKYNLVNKQVLTTFGLLSPNKGIDKAILAMKEISAKIPNAMYVVLGQTHPNLIENEGEKYREYLQKLIDDNNLHDNVLLINEYVPTDMLMEYLALTDIYLFTSIDPNQAVSGTFLYAMSAGCPIISNSFVLAKEMLDKNTGVILNDENENELAHHAIRILKDPKLKKEMSDNALIKTMNSNWKKVGQKHAGLFTEIIGTPDVTATMVQQYTT